MSAPGGVNLHAGLVALGGAGVLVMGASGSGKSSLLVSLLRAAAREGLAACLVADDRVFVERREGLHGCAPEAISGLIELRGVGILSLPVARGAQIALLVRLEDDPPRLPDVAAEEILGLSVPVLRLPARQAPFAADIVLTVLAAGPDALATT